MKGPRENSADSLGNLGPVVREAKPTTDPVREFEQRTDRPLIADPYKALESICDTLRKQWQGRPVITEGDQNDWKDIE